MRINKVKNFSNNFMYGIASKIVSLIFPFLIRTIIIEKLGTGYLGISSLFSAILQALNLAELGIGSSLVFNMYDPISKDDKIKLGQYLFFYKKCYRVIGLFILAGGLILLPFLKHLIKGTYPPDINIYLVYLIYLTNTVLTYWMFAYKNSIALAYQRTDIESKTLIYSQTFLYIIQIISLLSVSNYYWYVVWLPVTTILRNVMVSVKIDKLYPDIKEEGNLESNEISKIFTNIKSLFGHQVAFSVINSADSIILSAMIGLHDLTIYNNYYYIFSALSGFLTVFFGSIQAGIGNSIIIDDSKEIFQTFKRFRLITFLCVELAGIMLYALYNPFMNIWMGSDLMMNSGSVLIFAAGFFVTQVRRSVTTYKNAAGLWAPDFIKPYIVICADIIIDLILVKKVGSIGAMISTIVSMGFIAIPWETVVLYKYVFGKRPTEHFRFIGKEIVIFVVSIIITYFLSVPIMTAGLVGLIFRFAVSLVIGILCCTLFHFQSPEFEWVINRLKIFLKSKS